SVLLRGQVHCHTEAEDGLGITVSRPISVDDLVRKYRDENGYDFLAVSQHNVMSPASVGGWAGWAPNSVEITHGRFALPVENDSHVLALGCTLAVDSTPKELFTQIDSPTTYSFGLPVFIGTTVVNTQPVEATVLRINKVKAKSGLAYLAHPDSWPYGLDRDEVLSIIRQSRPDAMGLFTPKTDSQSKWDKVNSELGNPVWGYVEDDYHPNLFSRSKLANTWLAVPGETGESWASIKEKLRVGNFYCYWMDGTKAWPRGGTPADPPKITMEKSIGSSGYPTISITLSGLGTNFRSIPYLKFLGHRWGGTWALAAYIPRDSTYTYECTGTEKFIRAHVILPYTFGTLNISTQPVSVTKASGGGGGWGPQGVSLAELSPELILRSLLPSETPVPPAYGYIGDVFDVSTATGQLPANAHLQLSFDGEEIESKGGTRYLAIYKYDSATSSWSKIGGAVNSTLATIESPITKLGIYTISADVPADTAAPTVVFDNPPSGSGINQDTTARVSVDDDIGVWRVSFTMNGHPLAEDSNG
ncbi:MAG: hypothetical protein WCL39_15975, partial [Armatimonadota bacterium]